MRALPAVSCGYFWWGSGSGLSPVWCHTSPPIKLLAAISVIALPMAETPVRPDWMTRFKDCVSH